MKETIRRGDFTHVVRMPVRWGDMDALGHVNNAKFFTYDESARLDYFGTLMRDDPKFWKDYGLILAHIEADFLKQVRAPADLEIGLRIARIGRSSLHTLAGMFDDGDLAAVTRGVVVWFDYARGAALPVPEHVRGLIRCRELTAPLET